MRWFAGYHSPERDRQAQDALRRLATDHDGGYSSEGPLALALADAPSTSANRNVYAIAGRAYGIGELARELGLSADSDPERVLLTGFRRFGPQVLERLHGAFALVLWDAENARGIVGQDLTARSAVFVKETAAGIAFATEIRELLRILPSRPAPDRVAVSRMLAISPSPPGSTLFSGVRRLLRGSCLLLDRGQAKVVEFWQPRYEGTLRRSDEELTALVREQLTASVDRAVGGAERAGVLLSGGLDSSMVASLAAQRGVDVSGYSATFPGLPELDESPYVESIAEKWGIRRSSHGIPPRGCIAAALEYLDAWQIPVLGAGYLIEHTLTRQIAQDGPMAILDGQGGDELFGTSWYLPTHLVRRGRLLRSLEVIRNTPTTSEITSPRMLFQMWKHVALKPALPLALIEARRRRRGPRPTPPWLADSARHLYAESFDEWAWRRGLSGPFWWRWLADLIIDGPVAVGRTDYVRHRTALVGLDGGSPLLDFDLARLILRMPPGLAFDPSVDRPLARRSLQGVLPTKVQARTEKSNLFAFYREVLAGPDLAWIRRVLRDPGCAVWEYVDRSKMEPLMDTVPSEVDEDTAMLLGVLHTAAILEYWLRQQEDPASITALAEQTAAEYADESKLIAGELTR